MKADIITLCRSALAEGDELSIVGAFNVIHATSLPHYLLSPVLATRLIFEDTDEPGEHTLRLTVMDSDGRFLCDDICAQFYLHPPPAAESSLPEFVRRAAPLALVVPLPNLELKVHGEFALDIALDRQPPLRCSFFVYPASAVSSP